MDLEDIMLSSNKPDTERQTLIIPLVREISNSQLKANKHTQWV